MLGPAPSQVGELLGRLYAKPKLVGGQPRPDAVNFGNCWFIHFDVVHDDQTTTDEPPLMKDAASKY